MNATPKDEFEEFFKSERVEVVFLYYLKKEYRVNEYNINRCHRVIEHINDIGDFKSFKKIFKEYVGSNGYGALRDIKIDLQNKKDDQMNYINALKFDVLDQINNNSRYSMLLINLINIDKKIQLRPDGFIDPYLYFVFLIFVTNTGFSYIKNHYENFYDLKHYYKGTIKDISNYVLHKGFSEWAVMNNKKIALLKGGYRFRHSNKDLFLFSCLDYNEYNSHMGGGGNITIDYVALKKAWDSKSRRDRGDAKCKRDLSITNKSHKYLAELAKSQKIPKLKYLEKLIEDEYNQKFPKT